MESTEAELSRKLLARCHLSVPERAALPNGRVRFSVLVESIAQALGENGWFPRQLDPARGIGEGAIIELRGEEIWLHEQHEIGYQRFSPIDSYRLPHVADAVRAFVKAIGGSPMDGVHIDWDL